MHSLRWAKHNQRLWRRGQDKNDQTQEYAAQECARLEWVSSHAAHYTRRGYLFNNPG